MTLANTFLLSLPPAERDLLQRAGGEVSHVSGHVLYASGGPMPYVYFPETAVCSIVVELTDGKSVESASIGREGFVGLSAILGESRSPFRLIVQVPGQSLRVPTSYALEVSRHLPEFRALAARYAEITMIVMSQSAACLAVHPVVERCARWLLTTADRTGSESFHLTHEFLAAMLGVHRPTVSVAAATLQAADLIQYHRGVVEVLDRQGLERASCECYETVQRATATLRERGGEF